MILTLTILVLAAASRKMKILRPLNTRIVQGITLVKYKLSGSAQPVSPLIIEQTTHSSVPPVGGGNQIVISDDDEFDYGTHIVALVIEQEALFPSDEFAHPDASDKCKMSDLHEIH